MTVNFKVLRKVDETAFHRLLKTIRKLTGEIVEIVHDKQYMIIRAEFKRSY